MANTYISQEKIARAQMLRDSNCSWAVVADRLGFSINCIRKKLDPEFREKQKIIHSKKKADVFARGINASMPKPPLLARDKLLERLRAGYR